MWMFLMMVCLLAQNQAAPLPWEQSSLQPILQQQLDQTTGQTPAAANTGFIYEPTLPSPAPDVGQQTTSSSSSSSSESVSSESSQSSEGPQQLRERQKLENTAVEQMDSSQESSELLQSPSNSSSSLWLNELVLLGERAGERDRERDTGDDSVESRENRRRALLLTFHHFLSPPRLGGRELSLTAGEAVAGLGGATITDMGGATITDVGGADGEVGVVVGEEGGVREDEMVAEFPRLLDDSRERADGLTLDTPGHAHHHGYHGNEAGLELGL